MLLFLNIITIVLVFLLSINNILPQTGAYLQGEKKIFASGNIASKGDPWKGAPFLYGVNTFDWETWNTTTVERELREIRDVGFNSIKIPLYYNRFIEWNLLKFDPSLNQDYYEKVVFFMNEAKQLGLLVEAVPMEPWKFGDSMEHWWTNEIFQQKIYFFYNSYAQWVKDMEWDHIPFISIWWEAHGYLEWVDGHYVLEHSLQSYDETNNDWRNWLSSHDIIPVDLSYSTIDVYIVQYQEWSRIRFNQITQLKINAVKEGWSNVTVGGEIGFALSEVGWGGPWNPSQYLLMSAKSVLDVLLPHDYFDVTWWSLEPYLDNAEGKIIVCDELGLPLYTGVGAYDTDEAWTYIEPKLEIMINRGNGFYYWAWKDYDSRDYGLKDINFNPKPILQLMKNWLSANGL